MKLHYFYPLAGFVIPTVVIGYGIGDPAELHRRYQRPHDWFCQQCHRRVRDLLLRRARRRQRSQS